MVKILTIFDTSLSHRSLSDFKKNSWAVDLFPLTSNCSTISNIKNAFSHINPISITLLNSAKYIDYEVRALREDIIDAPAQWGNIEIKGKTLREWFMLPDGNVSAWWFGLQSDKDAHKCNAFFQVCQLNAILNVLRESVYQQVILILKDSLFKHAVVQMLQDMKIPHQILRGGIEGKFIARAGIRMLRENIPLILIFFRFLCAIWKKIMLQRYLPVLPKDHIPSKDALIFITYFPQVEKDAAKEGIFRNRYALPLQDICGLHGKSIVWILLHTPLDGYSFKDAVHLAARFVKRNEQMFFIENFLTIKAAFYALWISIKKAIVWKRIKSCISAKALARPFGNNYIAPLLIKMLDQSFYGDYIFQGTLYYMMFQSMFSKLRGVNQCLYYCEMQSWEKALIAAKRKIVPGLKSIGYQHSSISFNYWHYLHSMDEITSKNLPSGLPLPDILAANGDIPKRMLEGYYGKVESLEAIRYLYINDYLKMRKNTVNKRITNDEFVFMVCTTIDLKESRIITSLVLEAFPSVPQGLQIWFKGHPSLPVEEIFKEVGVSEKDTGYQIKTGKVSELLTFSQAVLVGTSTVAIEALTFGCEVIVFISPDMPNQSPLVGFEEYYQPVYSPQELRDVIERLKKSGPTKSLEKCQDFVKTYWKLNPSLDAWKEILQLR